MNGLFSISTTFHYKYIMVSLFWCFAQTNKTATMYRTYETAAVRSSIVYYTTVPVSSRTPRSGASSAGIGASQQRDGTNT